MKKATKVVVGVLAGIGLLAIIPARWVGLGRRAVMPALRTPIPGYASSANVFDANGRPGVRYLYPAGMVFGNVRIDRARVFFVPIDVTLPGVWSDA